MQRTIDEFVGSLRTLLFLKMLYDTMAVKRVCDCTMELELDADTDAISRHQSLIHFHFLLRIAITRFAIPFIFILAFLACFWIQLEWQIFHCELDIFGVFGSTKLLQCCNSSLEMVNMIHAVSFTALRHLDLALTALLTFIQPLVRTFSA